MGTYHQTITQKGKALKQGLKSESYLDFIILMTSLETPLPVK